MTDNPLKIETDRDLLSGQLVARVNGLVLVPKPEDEVATVGDLLRWLGGLDDGIRDDKSDNSGLADLVNKARV